MSSIFATAFCSSNRLWNQILNSVASSAFIGWVQKKEIFQTSKHLVSSVSSSIWWYNCSKLLLEFCSSLLEMRL
jgi:hypothetical protein